MPWPDPDLRELVRAALAELGVVRLVLAIHGASFPVDPDEDPGAGSPGSRAGARLLELAHRLGFTAIQLGPSGETSRDNPSPYDGTVFSRAHASIPIQAFAAGGELAGLADVAELARHVGDGGARGDHRRAHDVTHALVAAAWSAYARGARPDLASPLARFRTTHAGWLARDALYVTLAAAYGDARPETWAARGADPIDATLWHDDAPDRVDRRAELARRHARACDAYAFGQFLAHVAHDRVRATARGLGLALYADLQVGFAPGDAWGHAAAFLPGYAMGAPPSRTNPAGQAWNYPVLDPARSGPGGAARALVRARADKAFAEYDAVRIDHPHGLVCPWVYRADTPDPEGAVRAGARLRESPDLPDHPELAPFAIVGPDQLDRSVPRHADRWVRAVTPAQVERYAVLFDEIVGAAEHHGRSAADLTCEVLSTLPVPLARVLTRHRLGRWRVLHKADLDDPDDVYRPERAARADWVMLGNHDTAPIYGLIAGWDDDRRGRWARHLGDRLALAPASAAALVSDPGALAAAMFAELLASPAENVLVFFADLFGCTERFNVPGTVSSANWSLRLTADFAANYRDRLAHAAALNLPLALALALRARGAAPALTARLAALAAGAGTPLPAGAGAG
jgi:4-alpha-glucanotransferase